MVLIFLQALLVILFLVGSRIYFGMTRSWSAIYYRLEDVGKEHWFVWIMAGVSLPLMAASTLVVESTLDMYGAIVMNIGGTAIIFSGLAGDSRATEIVERNHVIGATGGMILAGASMWLFGLYEITLLMGVGCLIMYEMQFKNHTHYIESYVEALVVVGFLIKFGVL